MTLRSRFTPADALRGTIDAVAVVAALWHVVLLGSIVTRRLTFPLDLEWLEGSNMEEAYRATHTGAVLYGDPALGHQTQIYAPLYFAIVGAVGRVVGLDFWVARLVSIAAFVATLAIVARTVARHAPASRLRLVLAGVTVAATCAAYPQTGAWYDLARVDSLAWACVALAAMLLGAPTLSWRRGAASGVALAMAVYTKQTCAVVVPWMALFGIARDRRAGIAMVLAFVSTSGVALGALQVATDGWFWRWVMLGGKQRLYTSDIGRTALLVLRFTPYLPLVLVLVAWLAARRALSAPASLWTGVLLSVSPIAVASAVKAGGFLNALVPIYLFAPMALVLSFVDLLRGPLRRHAARAYVEGAFLVASAIYLFGHTYAWSRFVPTADERARADRAIATVDSLDGGAAIPAEPFLGRRSRPRHHQPMLMGYIDLAIAGVQGVDLKRDLVALDAAWLVLPDFGDYDWFRQQVANVYELECVIDPAYVPSGALMAPARLVHRRVPRGSPPRPRPVVTVWEAPGFAGFSFGHTDEGAAGVVHARSLSVGPGARAYACGPSACRDYGPHVRIADLAPELGGATTAVFTYRDVGPCGSSPR